MSNLEATGQRAPTAGPISTSAVGKLRTLGAGARLLGQTDGLTDAFADVFAHIAQSQPIEQQDHIEAAQDSPALGDANAAQSDESDASESDSGEQTAETENGSDAVLVEQNVEVDLEIAPLDNGEEEVSTDDEVELKDDQAELQIAPVEVNQNQDEQQEVDQPVVVVQQSASDDGDERHQRRRGDTKVTELANQQTGPKVDRANHDSADGEAIGRVDSTDTQEEASQEDRGDAPADVEPRRLRGRRRSDRVEHFADPKQVSAQKDEAAQRVASLQQTDSASAGLAANQLGDAASASRASSAKSSAAQVAPVSQVNTQAAQSQASGGNGSSPQGGHRNPTQAIDSMTAAATPKDKPNANAAKNNTAETVSRVKLIQRVSKAFQHLGPEGGVVRLRLAPAEMGSVRVEMRIAQRKVQARVVAETEAATAALREHLPELRQRLESQGMQIERIEVESEQGESRFGNSQHGHDGGPGGQSDSSWQQWQRQSRANHRNDAVSPSVSQSDAGSQPTVISSADGSVDVHF